MRVRRTSIFGVIGAALLGLAAGAATLQQLSMDQMTREATSIVRAKVTGVSASFSGTTIYTHYKLQVSESWKGSAPAEVLVPGGVANGYQQSFPGAPQLQTGSEYVLFLWKSRTGITHIIGLTQGLFTVDRLVDGSVVANRRRSAETMLDANGGQVEDRGLQLGLQDLMGRVTQSMRSGAGAAR